ncbi:hypothetical protein F4823DRAFT_203662 [Ustulina deusta]|nr:hypothetical protein F4823DRAFT_203662 [Ustulina deusta]
MLGSCRFWLVILNWRLTSSQLLVASSPQKWELAIWEIIISFLMCILKQRRWNLKRLKKGCIATGGGRYLVPKTRMRTERFTYDALF